jgi:membrane protease YdiL (CAAX protease family)
MGIVAGLMVGFFEELGWTGFAVPHFGAGYGIIATGIIVGILWGAWHFLLFLEHDSFSATFPLALLLARLFSWLPAYRVLMVWVHERTESLLVVILMHASLVATLTIIDPVLTGAPLLTFILTRAALLWLIVAVVAVASRQQNNRSKIGEHAGIAA